MVVDGMICEACNFEEARRRRHFAAKVVEVRAVALAMARVALEVALCRFERAAVRYQSAHSQMVRWIKEEEALAASYDGNGITDG